MRQKTIIESLKRGLAGQLPGEKAHFKMIPRTRLADIKPIYRALVPKESSVLILLYPLNDFLGTILIKRTEDKSVHSGQISFPGGKKDKNDKSHIQTALREAEEETGINPENITIIGRLSSLYVSPSNFMIHPVLGYIEKIVDLKPNPTEVEYIIELPLNNLGSYRTETDLEVRGYKLTQVPCFCLNGHVVWGATAMILQELLDILETI